MLILNSDRLLNQTWMDLFIFFSHALDHNSRKSIQYEDSFANTKILRISFKMLDVLLYYIPSINTNVMNIFIEFQKKIISNKSI